MSYRPFEQARKIFLITILLFVGYRGVFALEITEIMYDLSGSDEGREWIEIHNNESSPKDLSNVRFFESNSAHKLTLISGEMILPPNGYTVISNVSDKFLIDNSNFTGTLFDSSFSLSNDGEALALKEEDTIFGEMSYTSELGAKGDGTSLSRVGSTFVPRNPTPGQRNAEGISTQSQTTASTTQSGESQSNTSYVTNSSSNTSSASVTLPERIKLELTSPQRAFAGVPVSFKVTARGVEGKVMSGVRFVWNFGDGVVSEGDRVSHTYSYVGTYKVFVDGASGDMSGVAMTTIVIEKPSISIARISNEGVAIINNSKNDADISSWQLGDTNKMFIFPARTILTAGHEVIFPNSVTGLSGLNAKLFFPNGVMVTSIEPMTSSQSKEVVSIQQTKSIITPPPPIQTQKNVNSQIAQPKTTLIPPASPIIIERNIDSNQKGTASVIEGVPNLHPIWPYMMGVVGLASFGIIAYLLLIKEDPETEADQYEIIEDKSGSE